MYQDLNQTLKYLNLKCAVFILVTRCYAENCDKLQNYRYQMKSTGDIIG